MVKLNLNLNYKNRRILTSCQRHEIPEKIEDIFKINFIDVYLCTKNGELISNLQDITDVMIIQIIDKKDGLKSLRSQKENDSSIKLVNSIISNLERNSPLSGDERVSLIAWLKKNSSNFSKTSKVDDDVAAKKRKLDDDYRREKANKGVQTPTLRSAKKVVDGSTQTALKKSKLDEDNRREKANKGVQTPTLRSTKAVIVKDGFTQTALKKSKLDEDNRREKANKGVQTPTIRSAKAVIVKDGFTQTALKKSKLDDDNRREKANKRVQTPTFRSAKEVAVKDGFTQTDGLNYTEKEVNATELIDEMKKLAVGQTLDDNLTAHLMNLTFDERRNFILLKAPSVTLIKSKYPLLFTAKNEVKNELDRIFYTGKCKEFLKNMEDYSKVILAHCKKSDEIRVMTEKRMARARTNVQRDYAEVVGSVFALSKLLGEKFRFIHLLNYPHGGDDAYPHIDASYYSLKDLFFDNVIFNIVVEEMKLCEASNFFEAILCLVSSFYVFNIDYPESCKRTLTCFEKMYLCANETDVDETTSQIIELLSSQVKRYRHA